MEALISKYMYDVHDSAKVWLVIFAGTVGNFHRYKFL